MNCASAPGTTITDCAKMIGMTPAELMRSGMKFFAASRIRPRAIVRCGIWIGMRRAAIVIATTAATTATIEDAEQQQPEQGRRARLYVSERRHDAGQKRSTIEKKIISDAPLPSPRSVICSPSHITNIAPVVRKKRHLQLEAEARVRHRALQRLSVKSANPHACTAASATVA